MGRRPLPGRRAEICRTAAQIIRERGFEATSLADIAKAIGISKSGLYHYTNSKHALLFEIMMFGLDQIEAEVVSPVRGIADPQERLYEVVNRHIRIATRAGGAVSANAARGSRCGASATTKASSRGARTATASRSLAA